MNTQKKSGRGCLFWCGIIAAIFFLVVLLVAYAGYRYVKYFIAQYTDTNPVSAPALHLSRVEVTNLQQRIHTFSQSIKDNKAVEPLSLSADEINALIANETKSNASPARLYFNFNSNQVQAQLSLPTDGWIGHLLDGRYLNGSGNFGVSLHEGHLSLRVKSIAVKGRPLPENFMMQLRAQNFAEGWTNDPDLNATIAKLEEIKIENGRLIVIPRPREAEAEPKLEKPEVGK